MFFDQILDKIYHIFRVFKYFQVFSMCFMYFFVCWTRHDPNRTRFITEPNPNRQTLITLLGPTILDPTWTREDRN